MATFLAHLQVKPGAEVAFERTAAALRDATHANESRVLRYEYWRGGEPGSYYTLASFEDFDAFLEHQTSDHHERIGRELMAFVDNISFEWVDPMSSASPLPQTAMQPLADGASELTASYHERFAVRDREWWEPLHQGG